MSKTIALAFLLLASIQLAYTVREYAVDSETCCADNKFQKDDGTCGACVDDKCKCKTHPETGDSNNECTVCPTDCKTCNKGTECLICNTGKDLKADKSCAAITTTLAATCATQSHTSTCATCAKDKQKNAGGTACEACGTGCAECSDTACTKCTTAGETVQVTTVKNCAACDATCATCEGTTADDCWSCKPNAAAEADGSLKSNVRASGTAKAKCANPKVVRCKNGQVMLTADTCTDIATASAIYGCLQYARDSDFKAQVFHGAVTEYYCIKCKANFVEAADGTSTVKKTCSCDMTTKAGDDCTAITAVAGCAKYQKGDKTKCETCADKKVRAVDGSTCTDFTSPTNCLQVNPATVTECTKCAAGFKINAAKTCEAHGIAGCTTNNNDVCTKCEDGYSPSKDAKKCVACHKNCKYCYSKCPTNGCRVCWDATNTEKGSCACKEGWEYKDDPKKCVEKASGKDDEGEKAADSASKLFYSMMTLVVVLLFL